MATVQSPQSPHWNPDRSQVYGSPPGHRLGPVATGNVAYSYAYASPDMTVSVPYQWDPYYQTSQQQSHQWNYQMMPSYGLPSSQQTMLHMPLPSGQHSIHVIPTSPVGWAQSPQFWQPSSSQAPQPANLPQTVPISPQHGPPRRPIQSRHALWVGNIPSHTPILALRDHFFTPETASDILSVVFTPSSNSGFINFRSGEACKASMRRFNKSFLYGVPLNCRARKPTLGAGSVPRSPPALVSFPSSSSYMQESPIPPNSPRVCDPEEVHEFKGQAVTDPGSDSSGLEVEINSATPFEAAVLSGLQNLSIISPQGRNRYFIIKSLTFDDLVNSVKSRRWSTQVQNESFLNDAYKAGDFVYLIFSVNRSREYFGYARMTSPPEYDAAPIVTSTPTEPGTELISAAAKPPILRTPAAGLIPAGRIIDELCRGKIFWEIDDPEDSTAEFSGGVSSMPEGLQKSFEIEWLSLKRIPFRQTTHLRNQLNENKEVKIARDGTELDADVGRRLCSLFHVPA